MEKTNEELEIKIKSMLSLLSSERINGLESYMNDYILKLTGLGYSFKEGKNVNMTLAYDKEEPKQFIYVSVLVKEFVSDNKINNFNNGFNSSMNDVLNLTKTYTDLEVFNEDNINHWLDWCDKIKNDDTIKVPDKDEKKNNFDISSYFDFYGENISLKNKCEYIDKYKFACNLIVNRVMETEFNFNSDTLQQKLYYISSVLKMLQNYFSKCNFFSFSKYELEMVGFKPIRIEKNNVPYDIEDGSYAMMIPIWALPVICKNDCDKTYLKYIKNGDSFCFKPIRIDEEKISGESSYGTSIYGILIQEK